MRRDEFKDVYDHLTDDEKFDLLHLLIKKIVYFEEAELGKNGEKKGKIKMDLWELPPINPSKVNSANDFLLRVTLGSPGRTRTSDRVVNSHLLYRLSYRGIIGMDKKTIRR